MENAKQPSPVKPQVSVPKVKAPTGKAPIEKAPEAKAPITPKVSAPANPTTPKTAPRVQSTPLPKPEPLSKPEPAAGMAPSTKFSAFTKLATKGFVIQSWQIAVAVAVVLALVTGGVLLGTVLGEKGPELDDSAINYDWDLSGSENTNADGIILPGYPTLTFPAGQSEIAILLPNPSKNPCFFRYTLSLVETNEVLYQSGLIKPGTAIPKAELSRALPAGTYTLRITIDTFSLSDGTTPMNGGLQEVKLIVQ